MRGTKLTVVKAGTGRMPLAAAKRHRLGPQVPGVAAGAERHQSQRLAPGSRHRVALRRRPHPRPRVPAEPHLKLAVRQKKHRQGQPLQLESKGGTDVEHPRNAD